jgi:hypothetical protein
MLANLLYAKPRSGMHERDTPDVLVSALADLRKCTDSIDTLILVDSLPDILLPALAWEASRRTHIPTSAVGTLVRYCGPLFLERCLGKKRARELRARVEH